jgi:exodeoxyribonuclease V gamma subunit
VERLLLGLALPGDDTAPCHRDGDVEELGRGLALLLVLLDVLRRFRRPRPAHDWATLLAAVTGRLFGGTPEREWELVELLRAVAAWGERGRHCTLPLEAAVVARGLEEELAADSGRFGHRSGALTISALEPMRAIPHRVIVLMGLDAACFPRHRPRPGFHLMEQERRLGDPGSTDQDRYVLLEALMSARQHLLVTWTSRDERSGEALPPALPVQQWLDQLGHELRRSGGGEESFAGLLHDHPPNPLDRANFLPRDEAPPPSCDRRLLRARALLDGGEAAPPAAPLGRQPCPEHDAAEMSPWEDLLRWLIAPQRHWLARRGLQPREWLQPLQDEDPLELERRTGRRLLEEALERSDRCEATADGPDWPRLLGTLGLLPRGAAAELAVADLDRHWQALQRQLQPLGPPEHRIGGHGPLRVTNRWHGRSLVMVTARGSHGAQRLELWARLLLAVVGGEEPERALLIAPGRRDGRFERSEELRPPGPDEARERLEELLGLRESCRERCWPVPPRTGWTYVTTEDPDRRSAAADRVWAGTGAPDQWPERERPEMVLCFGERLPFEALLGERFEQACRALYGPLLAQRHSP